jgi:hypothetical protein
MSKKKLFVSETQCHGRPSVTHTSQVPQNIEGNEHLFNSLQLRISLSQLNQFYSSNGYSFEANINISPHLDPYFPKRFILC